MTSIELEDIPQSQEKPDFRRANGSPMVMIDGKNQRFSRPSGFGKLLDDESALTNWRIDRAVAGVAGDPALQARAIAVETTDRAELAAIRDAAINAGRGSQAADIGTALHAMSERFEKDSTFSPPSPYLELLEQYGAALDHYGLTTEAFEFQVVNTEYRVAGTCDRRYLTHKTLVAPDGEIIPPGTRLIGDLKTGKSLDFSTPGYVVQMALYRDGQMYDVVNDEFLPTPETHKKWGVIIHLPSNGDGECRLMWCDLDQGREGAWIVSLVKEWRKAWRSGHYVLTEVPDPQPDTVVGALREQLGAEEIDMKAWVLERISVVKQNEAALKRLLQKWPDGVPTPKQGLEDIEHLRQLDELLASIEAQFELSFIPIPIQEAKEVQE